MSTSRLILVLAAIGWSGCVAAQCPPEGQDLQSLQRLKQSGWQIDAQRERDALALALTDCLASPDPNLRDGIAYEAYATLLRSDALDSRTVNELARRLQTLMSTPSADGFAEPFAALVLSEVIRRERRAATLGPERRQALLDAAVTYVTSLRDYRGFDDREGWRHGVAHGADLLAQLAQLQDFKLADLRRIRGAVAAQVAPSAHFYIYDEGSRLAAVILALARRNAFDAAEWSAWLEQLSSPRPLASWREAYGRNTDLARLHNLRSFLQALWLGASRNDSTADDVLLPGTGAALTRLGE